MTEYDPACERRDVAVRMLWKLYKRQNGLKLLKELGLSERDCEVAFKDHPYPKTQKDVFAVIGRCHAVARAAEEVMRRYITETAETRNTYYRKGKAA